MVSGVATPEEKKAAWEVGVDAYLDKFDLRQGVLTKTSDQLLGWATPTRLAGIGHRVNVREAVLRADTPAGVPIPIPESVVLDRICSFTCFLRSVSPPCIWAWRITPGGRQRGA